MSGGIFFKTLEEYDQFLKVEQEYIKSNLIKLDIPVGYIKHIISFCDFKEVDYFMNLVENRKEHCCFIKSERNSYKLIMYFDVFQNLIKHMRDNNLTIDYINKLIGEKIIDFLDEHNYKVSDAEKRNVLNE